MRQFYRDVDNNGAIVDFNAVIATTRKVNLKVKITGKTGNDGTKRCWNNGTIKIFK